MVADQQGTLDERSPLLRQRSASLHHDDGDDLSPPTVDATTISRSRAAACAAALAILIIVQATNFSLLTVTQSIIAADLDVVSGGYTTWFTSAYLIALSSLAPLYGKLASIITPRLTISIAAGIVALGSILTGTATDFTGFVAGRAVTGAGSAGVFIVALIVILDLAEPAQRGLWLGLSNMLLTTGVSIGAALAGALLPYIGWRALFWGQAPLVSGAGIVLLASLPRGYTAQQQQQQSEGAEKRTGVWQALARQDYLGAVTLTVGLVLALLAMSDPHSIPVAPLIASAVVLVAFVVIELRFAAEPIVPIALLRSRGLFFTCAGTMGYMMARWTVLFFSPTYAIAIRGWSTAAAGSMLIPTTLGFATGSLLVGWLHITRNGSFYVPSLITYTLFPITLLILAFAANTQNTQVSPAVFIVATFCNGFLAGSSLNYTFAHMLHLTPKDTHYMATSLLSTFRGFAGSFASAAGGGYFVRQLRASLTTRFRQHGLEPTEELIKRLLGSPALVRDLSGDEQAAAVAGYADALKALWLGAACLGIVFIAFQVSAGPNPPRRTPADEEGARENGEAANVDSNGR